MTKKIEFTKDEIFVAKENLEQHVRICQDKEGGQILNSVLEKLEEANQSE